MLDNRKTRMQTEESGKASDDAAPGGTIEGGEHREPALLYCPVCSTRLEGRRCKLICTVCGYFMSCADYY